MGVAAFVRLTYSHRLKLPRPLRLSPNEPSPLLIHNFSFSERPPEERQWTGIINPPRADPIAASLNAIERRL